MTILFLLFQVFVTVFLFFKSKQETQKTIRISLAILFMFNGWGALSRFCHNLDGHAVQAPYFAFVSFASIFFLNRIKLDSTARSFERF